jgi:gluconate 2-dehydrogenase gamma chain
VRGHYTRRQFLSTTAKAGAVGLVASALPFPRFIARKLYAADPSFFTAAERATLDAALARMIPADGAGDWSAADIGVTDYIERLLVGFDIDASSGDVYGGGPYRCEFSAFQPLSEAKKRGWQKRVEQLRDLYRQGLADLDSAAGGSFAALPELAQDAILESFDLQGSPFFAALYNHTMEGAYSHPVYGGNTEFTSWKALSYQGDVHGVRFPMIGDADAPWNVYGGYAPEEMILPGPGNGPVTGTGKC